MFQSSTEVALNEPSLSAHLSTPKLAGKSLALSFKPASQADIDTLNSLMPQPHADGTPIQLSELPTVFPGYLINLTPEITIDGQTVASGGEYLLGQEVTAYIGFKNPVNEQLMVEKLLRAGEYHALGVDLQGISSAQIAQLNAKLNTTTSKLEANQLIGLTKHDLTGDMLQAGVQGYFSLNDAIDKIAAVTTNTIAYRAPSFGTFSTNLIPNLTYGIPLNVRSEGVMMDIDRLQRQVTDKNNDIEKTKSFMLSQGSRQSANEHLIPEQMFSTSTQQSIGISAVKALQIAASQGQKIYVITQANIANVLPQLQHKAAIGDDIVNAVNAGNVVTISQNDINYSGGVWCWLYDY